MKKGISGLLLGVALTSCLMFSGCYSMPISQPKEPISLPKELNDFERATLAMANQVADLFEYDWKNYDISSMNTRVNSLNYAFETGKTLCGGYSKLFYKLAEEAGYDVYYIRAFDHAYNAILFEGTRYFFDVTSYDSNRNNRNAYKWLWQTELWDDPNHANSFRVYKLDGNYERYEFYEEMRHEGYITRVYDIARDFYQSEGDFKVLIMEGGKVRITGYTGSGGAAVIPTTIEGKPVVDISIGNYAFKGCTNLTSVSIPVGVTSIGYNAFFTNKNYRKNFRDYYITNGKKAGVYTFRNDAWSYAAQ